MRGNLNPITRYRTCPYCRREAAYDTLLDACMYTSCAQYFARVTPKTTVDVWTERRAARLAREQAERRVVDFARAVATVVAELNRAKAEEAATWQNTLRSY